ncbi:MAG TPA: amino acid adenylation domain-containing protein [Methylobacter sp.]|jgi:aspartate racemase
MNLLGRFVELPAPHKEPVTVQFAECVELKPEMIESMERLLVYWKTQLTGAPTLDLPTDRPRPAVPSFRGEIQQFSLSPDLVLGLKELSRRENVTLFMTLAAAFQVLLQRYSGQDDIVIGTPAASSSYSGSGSLHDFSTNTLALRTDLSGNLSFCELLAQVRGVTLGAYAHQGLPFEKLVDALNLQQDRSRNPLFQVMLIVRSISDDKLQLNEMAPELVKVYTEAAQSDLILELSETPHALAGSVTYAADLFEAETIIRLIGHFQTLLEGIIARPEARLSELPLLSEPERRRVLEEWNDTTAPFPRDQCIHDLFEAQAARTPQAVAVAYEDSQLTYAELNAQANRLAHHLRELGVKPDALVALCVERGLNMVVGLLAILKAGGAYVPLDPAYPKERLAFMLEDSDPVAVLTQGRLEHVFADAVKALPVIDLDADCHRWMSQPETNPDHSNVELTAENLAYVIYTSGSTGQPKGVMVTHRNAVHSTSARFVCYREPVSAYLLLSSFAFDSSVAGLFWTLGQGGCLCLPTDDDAKDPAALVNLIANRRISHLLALPSFYMLLLKQTGSHLRTLKTAIVAGEACSTEVVKQHYAALPHVPLYNEYGPTEGSVWSSVYLTDKDDCNRPIPIGRPISNVRLYILDGVGNPVPIGVQGELHVGGEGVARGYWRRPELTAEKFIPDPFQPGCRLYKTGDLGRWLADGTIEYLGRNDFQVKIRGFRIELGEIETMLCQHPQLREAAVAVHEPTPGDKRLAAYLVAHSNATPTASELQCFLKPQLPEFMVPSAFVFLEALPITPNGKLNRNALPEPDQHRQVLDADFIAPRSQVEKQLTEVWRGVLSVNRIGIHDNFFELGGQSLLVAKMLVEINKLFNIDLSLGAVYQYPTIKQLATLISSNGQKSSWYSLVPIQTQGSRPPLFAIHTITLQDLPRHLGKDQPLYFLRYGMAAELNDHPIQLPALEELASHYIKELQQVQPEGPYYLAGFSFGGVIAYEMARQLQANGHRVNLVALLDTYLDWEKRLLPLHRIIYKLVQHSPGRLLTLAKNKITDLATSNKNGADFWPHIYTLAPDLACRNAYQPKSYNGRVVLFQGYKREGVFFSYALPENAWRKLLGENLEVQQIAGDHIEIFNEPHTRTLAEKLMSCMGKPILVRIN